MRGFPQLSPSFQLAGHNSRYVAEDHREKQRPGVYSRRYRDDGDGAASCSSSPTNSEMIPEFIAASASFIGTIFCNELGAERKMRLRVEPRWMGR